MHHISLLFFLKKKNDYKSGEHQQEPEKPLGEEYTYDASFFSTWTMTAWASLFLPLYALCCALSCRFGPRQLAAELRDSVLAFRDKGFTLGTVKL